MRLSEQLADVLKPSPYDSGLFIVKLLNLTNENYPGRDACGVLPLVVVGYEGMSRSNWSRWVKEQATSAYGTSYANKLAETGIDLKEMTSTSSIGRYMRKSGFSYPTWDILDNANSILSMVEKWPSLYNTIAEEISEEPMTLSEFINRVRRLPTPYNINKGKYSTLGDLLGATMVPTPDF
jgi:hypothetical protein